MHFSATPTPTSFIVLLVAAIVVYVSFVVYIATNTSLRTRKAENGSSSLGCQQKEQTESFLIGYDIAHYFHTNTARTNSSDAKAGEQVTLYKGCEDYNTLRPISCFPREPPPPLSPCRDCAKQVHLAPGKDASTSITVSFSIDFSCGRKDDVRVLLGTDPSRLKHTFMVENEENDVRQYNSTSCNAENPQDCRIKGVFYCHSKHFGTYISDWIYHIRIHGLQPDTEYHYKIDPGFCNQQHRYRFKTAPSGNGVTTKIAVLGDPGQSGEATITFNGIDEDPNVDLAIITGDITYANRDHRRWDSWFEKYETVLSRIPTMTTPGNHDLDPDCCDWAIFRPYQSRFAMPELKPAVLEPACLQVDSYTNKMLTHGSYDFGNAYYSVTIGLAHIIVLNTYSDATPESNQFRWVQKELKSVDRTKTPWLIVTAHSNLYESYRRFYPDDAQMIMKKHIEPLLVKYGVNIYFAGHDHAYSRTYPVAFDLPNDEAPTYITIGNAGRGHHQKKAAHDQPWVVHWDDWSFGFGTITFANESHAYWKTHFHNSSRTEYVANTDRTFILNNNLLRDKNS